MIKRSAISLHIIAVIFFSGSQISIAQSLDIDQQIGKEGSLEVIQQIGIYENEELSNT